MFRRDEINMKLIPAIDLKQGECVRLLQGKKDRSTSYSTDPIGMAKHWVDQGARRLHIVDLDGAFEEPTANREVIQSILETVDVPCQVGGGLRSKEAVRNLLGAGADAAIIGTAGIKNPELLEALVGEFGSDSIVAGVDCRDGNVLVRGWKEASQYGRDQWVELLNDLGIQRIVYTDVSRDGTEEGPDFSGTEELLDRFPLDVIASGGIGSLDHLRRLKEINAENLWGVIVGRALYEKRFTVGEAKNAIREETNSC
jgi:phosphoribosylformimino-5-aminoimidazole carboxamide ribotide isomerase